MTSTLGFACHWDPYPPTTWSFTPWRLREALRQRVSVIDVGVQLPAVTRMALKAAYARPTDGRWVTTWKHTAPVDTLLQRRISSATSRSGCRAVVQIQDIAIPPVPFFVYQDLSYDVLLDVLDAEGVVAHFPGLSRSRLLRRRDRQREVYASATGVLAMSDWFGRQLVDLSGVPPEKVYVVHPGRTAAAVKADRPAPDTAQLEKAPNRPPALQRRRHRLIFVGKDFHTKGGDVVLRALSTLRRAGEDIELTVIGPEFWPLDTPPPAGVRYLGRVPPSSVAAHFDEADLLVMPSRLEGFGIVFVEALAHGLPCVARRAFAMPEIVSHGHNGALVDDDDPDRLAEAIASVLADESIYVNCWRERMSVATHYTWDRAARDVISAVSAGTSSDAWERNR